MKLLAGPILTTAEMQALELSSGSPLKGLMEAAGAALAEAVWRFGSGHPTLVLCGPGNNGGDGYVCARLLEERGLDVRVAAFGEPRSALALEARRAWRGPVEDAATSRGAAVFVDALFGTGLTRAIEPLVAEHLSRLAAAAIQIVAADLPSGVQADTGAYLGGVNANLTVAFGAAKPAHVLEPAASRCGTVLIAELGLKPQSNVEILSRPQLRLPTPQDHKYTRGMLAVIGGQMPGAAALSATAAIRAGAGYVVGVGVSGRVPHAVMLRDREEFSTVLADERIVAIVIGPGLGLDPAARDALKAAIECKHALVLDGDGLFEPFRRRRPATMLTPHDREFTRLFGHLEGSKIDRARAAAISSGATIIYKGADTVIASPDGRVTCARLGSPWLATAGTGDVLAGVAGAMLARGLEAHEAACAAVWLHGKAARDAGPGLIADDLPSHFAALL